MNETPLPLDPPPVPPASAGSLQTLPPAEPARSWSRIASTVMLIAFAIAMLVSLALSFNARDRVRSVEQAMARRIDETRKGSESAQMVAKQSQDSARESAAKVALLEARLAEVSLQRTQLEELIQSLTRSRDENLVVDIEAGLRVAQQQSTITGSAEPLVAALKQADERLARHSQPRLDGVRRAVARDIDRVKAVGVADIAALSLKLDEAVRLVDELPMLSQATPLKAAPPPVARAASSPAVAASGPSSWWASVSGGWQRGLDAVWAEARSLVRVTRVDHADAALLAPEQAFFVRENLKLRLLNARLALLSRQFDTTRSDLQAAQAMLERYFDRSSRRTVVATDLVRQVAASARNVGLPRPDESFAALATAAAGR